MLTVKYEHVPGRAWRLLAIIGESRYQQGAAWPISEPVYTLAQVQMAVCATMRDIRSMSTSAAVRFVNDTF